LAKLGYTPEQVDMAMKDASDMVALELNAV
jgi:hypothetical protein